MRMINARGFTLVETLVALMVLSMGLLGAAALLLDSLRNHASALRRVAASNLVRDMADRIRANPRGASYYHASSPAAPDCGETSGCDAMQLALSDLVFFETSALALFPRAGTETRIEFAPATGPAAPARYLITLRWSDARNYAGTDSVALQVLAQPPVAG
jgi:type IV pilus assembly protein PilV